PTQACILQGHAASPHPQHDRLDSGRLRLGPEQSLCGAAATTPAGIVSYLCTCPIKRLRSADATASLRPEGHLFTLDSLHRRLQAGPTRTLDDHCAGLCAGNRLRPTAAIVIAPAGTADTGPIRHRTPAGDRASR